MGCGSQVGAIVHIRADVGGKCRDNATAPNGFKSSVDLTHGGYGTFVKGCYEIQNTNRTTDPGCEADERACSYRRRVLAASGLLTTTTTTTTSKSKLFLS